MNFDWTVLFEFLVGLLSDCPNSTDDRLDVLRSGGLRVRLGVTRGLRSQGLRRRDLREARSVVLQEIAAATDDELKAFIECCSD